MKTNKYDIVKVISKYFYLKKIGSYYKSQCPFHNGQELSLMVDPEYQIFNCDICGATGNAIDFIMKYEKVNQETAWKILANK